MTPALQQTVPNQTPLESRPDTDKLRAHFGDAILDAWQFQDEAHLVVARDQLVEVCTFLRDDPECQYNFFSECLGVDYLDYRAGYRFEVVYNLFSVQYEQSGRRIGHNRRLFLHARAPEDDPVIPSVVGVWSGANFPEREVFDFFGVRFEGHPDLRRLFMADDWVGHPQRKDYPLGGERVQFPGGKYGPSVAEVPVQHPGESFYGRTGDVQGEQYRRSRTPTPDKGPGTLLIEPGKEQPEKQP